MYCKKCGAVINGKFCCCCGTRVRTELEDFRLAQKRARKSFIESCERYPDGVRFRGDLMHLGSACWEASSARYRKDVGFSIGDHVPPHVFESLETIRTHAEQLFIDLMNF